jgi:hypothetical protein
VPTDVVCPTCNTVSHFDELERDAEGFCSTCDYPLFWADRTAFATSTRGHNENERVGLRRLPGTEGWAVPQWISCPVCSEPNLLTEKFCIRCGADLHPQPLPPVYVPEPAPVGLEPEAQPVAKRDWLPFLVATAFVLVCLAVWLVAVYVVY